MKKWIQYENWIENNRKCINMRIIQLKKTDLKLLWKMKTNILECTVHEPLEGKLELLVFLSSMDKSKKRRTVMEITLGVSQLSDCYTPTAKNQQMSYLLLWKQELFLGEVSYSSYVWSHVTKYIYHLAHWNMKINAGASIWKQHVLKFHLFDIVAINKMCIYCSFHIFFKK